MVRRFLEDSEWGKKKKDIEKQRLEVEKIEKIVMRASAIRRSWVWS
jgi:hypothetical protein